MPKFISDDEMNAREGNSKRKFISDDEMTAREGTQASPKGYLDQAKEYAAEFGKATLDALPGLGGMTGGVLGGVSAGPGGAIAGAGVGGYLGSAAKNAINSYLNPEEAPKSNLEYITNPIQEGVENAAFEGGGQVVGRALGALPALGRKIAALTGGVSEDAVRARLAGNAGAYGKKVPNYADLSHASADAANKLGTQISGFDTEAWKALSPERNILTSQYMDMADNAIKDLTKHTRGIPIGDESIHAVSEIQKIKDQLQQFGDTISEGELKGIIQSIQKGIDYGAKTDSPATSALKGLRATLDQNLKEFNPSYKDAMKPVADRMQALDTLSRDLALERETGRGLAAGPSTEGRIKSLTHKNAGIRNENFDPITEFTGIDIPKAAQDYQHFQQFENTAPNGSRRTLLGKALGGAIGAGVGEVTGGEKGAATGALVGFAGDKYAGRVVGHLIDLYSRGALNPALSGIGKVLSAAAERGPQALMATHEILRKNNPEYKNLTQED